MEDEREVAGPKPDRIPPGCLLPLFDGEISGNSEDINTALANARIHRRRRSAAAFVLYL